MLEIIDARAQLTPARVPRPAEVVPRDELTAQVKAIVDDVRLRQDDAVLEHTERLDGVRLDRAALRVEHATVAKARSLVRPELIDALEVMAERLRRTCRRQAPNGWLHEEGDEAVGELVRPLRRVGIYVPGGRAAYPSTVVMTVVPAQVAGVEGIAVASPPGTGGEIAEPILAACAVTGIDEVYRIGGAQAVAALAYGTQSVRPVDKIVGPGNLYVTVAKRLVRGWVGTDAEAGPTEIAVVADESAPAEVVAADLVAQAEHGPHGMHALITWSEDLAHRVITAIEMLTMRHERADDVENALIEGGSAVLVRDRKHALETANALAPEHLQLMFEGAKDSLDDVRNAGAVFLGVDSPAVAGDYVAGTNHVLPSGGTARWSSGLGVADFTKRIYVARLERSALERLAPHVDALSEAEGLMAHGRALRARLGEGGM